MRSLEGSAPIETADYVLLPFVADNLLSARSLGLEAQGGLLRVKAGLEDLEGDLPADRLILPGEPDVAERSTALEPDLFGANSGDLG